LEALAGGAAIARNARQAVNAGKRTQLSSIQPVEKISAKDVGEAATLGDLVAQQIVAEAGVCLGIAITGVINLSNPSAIVVGGGVAQMGDLLLEPLRRVVRERCLRPAAQSVSITTAVLGRRSSSMGAVVQAVETALHTLTEGTTEAKGGLTNQEKPNNPTSYDQQESDPLQANREARSVSGPGQRFMVAGV